MQETVLVWNHMNEREHAENLDVDGGKGLMKWLRSDNVLGCCGSEYGRVTSHCRQGYKILSFIKWGKIQINIWNNSILKGPWLMDSFHSIFQVKPLTFLIPQFLYYSRLLGLWRPVQEMKWEQRIRDYKHKCQAPINLGSTLSKKSPPISWKEILSECLEHIVTNPLGTK